MENKSVQLLTRRNRTAIEIRRLCTSTTSIKTATVRSTFCGGFVQLGRCGYIGNIYRTTLPDAHRPFSFEELRYCTGLICRGDLAERRRRSALSIRCIQ